MTQYVSFCDFKSTCTVFKKSFTPLHDILDERVMCMSINNHRVTKIIITKINMKKDKIIFMIYYPAHSSLMPSLHNGGHISALSNVFFYITKNRILSTLIKHYYRFSEYPVVRTLYPVEE
jgi:hypothetical protein